MKNEIINTHQGGAITLAGDYNLSVRDLKSPQNVLQLVKDVRSIDPQKRKIDLNDIELLLTHGKFREDIVTALSEAVINSDDNTAILLWDSLGYRVRHSLVIYDDGSPNIDLIRKMDITGQTVRNAFLSKGSIAPPDKTPYAYIHGDTSVEAAHQLANLLKQMKKIKPEGDMLIREFFDEIDTRILYLMVISEAEWFEEIDYARGAYLQVAMESDDKIPNEMLLLSWIQENTHETFLELREELLNPIWQENRDLFWKGWLLHNRPGADPDYYEKQKGGRYLSRMIDEEHEDLLDELINIYEGS